MATKDSWTEKEINIYGNYNRTNNPWSYIVHCITHCLESAIQPLVLWSAIQPLDHVLWSVHIKRKIILSSVRNSSRRERRIVKCIGIKQINLAQFVCSAFQTSNTLDPGPKQSMIRKSICWLASIINWHRPIDDQLIITVVANFIDCYRLPLNSCFCIFRYCGSVHIHTYMHTFIW